MGSILTPKRKKFADKYLDSGNGTKAALESFDVTNENSAAAVASRALRSAKVQEYLHSKSEDAASMVYKLSQHSKQDFIKLNASKDILDRSGFGAVSKTESRNLHVEVKLEDTEVEKLRIEYEEKLKGKLIE